MLSDAVSIELHEVGRTSVVVGVGTQKFLLSRLWVRVPVVALVSLSKILYTIIALSSGLRATVIKLTYEASLVSSPEIYTVIVHAVIIRDPHPSHSPAPKNNHLTK